MHSVEVKALNDQAFKLLDYRDSSGAKVLFEKICTLDPHHSEAVMMLGVINGEEGNFKEAESLLRKAAELDPEYADAFYHLSKILQIKGHVSEAISCASRAVELDPEFTEARTLLASLCQQYPDAGTDVSHGMEANSTADFQSSLNQGAVLLQQGRLVEAASIFESSLQQQPGFAEAWIMLSKVRWLQTLYTEAAQCCREAIRLDDSLVSAHMMLASLLLMVGNTEEACLHSNKALALDPSDVNAIAMAANIEKHLGNIEKAYELLLPLLDEGTQHINVALAFAMISKDVGQQNKAINQMLNVLHSSPPPSIPGKINLYFNLGELYDDIKQYDEAFSHFYKGNELKKLSFDRQKHANFIEQLITTYTTDMMAKLPRAKPLSSSPRPIFIVGMVRSGTSLVEQILASHSEVYGAGELAGIHQISENLPGMVNSDLSYPQCVSQLTLDNLEYLASHYLDYIDKLSPDAKYVTDKLPANFMHLGLIELMFPDARIIHCTRAPEDTCLSAYFHDFSSNHPYAYNLSDLGAYYREYQKLMEHWRSISNLAICELKYEDLIADQEQISRTLVKFCGLEWEGNCLQFHKTKRFVKTASYDQVNRPIYTNSVARWKNYETHIGPLIEALKSK